MTGIRVLLVDDHELIRDGLRLLIDGQRDMAVVGEAGDGVAALASAQTLAPDVILLDISMPGMNGLDAARALTAAMPASALIALTRYSDAAYVQQLTDAGAAGYVLKQSASNELLLAIRTVAGGGRHFDAALGARSSQLFVTRRSRKGDAPRITAREAEVLRLMAVGQSNKDISAALNVAIKTVEVHKANAMRKLGLAGRIDVVRFAVLQGWLKEP